MTESNSYVCRPTPVGLVCVPITIKVQFKSQAEPMAQPEGKKQPVSFTE